MRPPNTQFAQPKWVPNLSGLLLYNGFTKLDRYIYQICHIVQKNDLFLNKNQNFSVDLSGHGLKSYFYILDDHTELQKNPDQKIFFYHIENVFSKK